MAMAAFKTVLVCVLFSTVFSSATQNTGGSKDISLLELMGSTSSKQYYITKEMTADFVYALHHTYPNIFDMTLASIDNSEEFSVLDSWFQSTFDNSSSSELVWTSGFVFGAAKLTWGANGKSVDVQDVEVSFPWPAGAFAASQYSWNRCLGFYKHCNCPQGSPSRCWPLQTEFYYMDCTSSHRVICQKDI